MNFDYARVYQYSEKVVLTSKSWREGLFAFETFKGLFENPMISCIYLFQVEY